MNQISAVNEVPVVIRSSDAKIWFDLMCVPVIVEGWRDDVQICWRHWGPAAALGYNGGAMIMLLAKEWSLNIAPKGSYSRKTRDRQWAAAIHLCCTLGDEKMFKLWQLLAPGASPVALVEAVS